MRLSWELMIPPDISFPRKKIAWAIVGTGRIATHFARDLQHVPGARLAAVCSRSRDRAISFLAGRDAQIHDRIDALMDDADVDAIYVATPNHSHFAVAKAGMLAGKGVLVEKPLAMNVAQAEQLATLAEQRQAFLMEGMWTRFLPAVAWALETVRSGALGELHRIQGELAFRRDQDSASHLDEPRQGGGVLPDLGVYLISLSLLLLGRPDSVVTGFGRPRSSDVDISADFELVYPHCRALLRCGIDRDGANLFVIEGSRACLILQPPFIGSRSAVIAPPAIGQLLMRFSGSPAIQRAIAKLTRTVPLPGVRHHAFDFPGYGLQFEIRAATEALAAGKTGLALSPVRDSIETLRIIEQIRGL